MRELILGGVKSGKSRLGMETALQSGLPVVYFATATARDEEMRRRIARHQCERPLEWELVEEPVYLAEALKSHATPRHCLLVDCLTLWLSNLLHQSDKSQIDAKIEHLVEVIPELPGQLIMISNETNQGIIPANVLGRQFCDAAGLLHQRLAILCDRVTLVVAGLPMVLKENPV